MIDADSTDAGLVFVVNWQAGTKKKLTSSDSPPIGENSPQPINGAHASYKEGLETS